MIRTILISLKEKFISFFSIFGSFQPVEKFKYIHTKIVAICIYAICCNMQYQCHMYICNISAFNNCMIAYFHQYIPLSNALPRPHDSVTHATVD